MSDRLAESLSIPSTYVRFALSGAPTQISARYVSDSVADWPSRSEVAVELHVQNRHSPPSLHGANSRGLEHSVAEDLLPTFRTLRDILEGRLGMLGAKDRIAVSQISNTVDGSHQSFSFSARVAGHPLYGSFAETRRLHVLEGSPALLLDVRVRSRGSDAEHLSHIGDLSGALRIEPERLTEFADEACAEPSPAFQRMEEQGIPPDELTPEIVADLCSGLRHTLPELHPMGHLVARHNIVLWACLNRPEPPCLPDLHPWCDEIARLALGLPDDLFRHFLAGSIRARTAVSLVGEEVAASAEIDCLRRYAALMSHAFEATQHELSTAVIWMLGALQNSADIELAREISTAISAVGNHLSLRDSVDQALDQAHGLSIGCGVGTSQALVGIRRAELAAETLQAATSRGRYDAEGNLIHAALFGKFQQYAFYYQGMLHGLDEDGINEGLERAASGMAPGILFLRPLSMLRTAYAAPPSLTRGTAQLCTLESALMDALYPLGQATNAVGGLADIRGMQRSGFAGVGEDWQMLVLAMIELAGAILVLPDVSDGMAWEIDTLLTHNKQSRTIFILLPADLDWSDRGNGRGFEIAFGIKREDLDPAGAFYIGHPSEDKKLPWESLWNGGLAHHVGATIRSRLRDH